MQSHAPGSAQGVEEAGWSNSDMQSAGVFVMYWMASDPDLAVSVLPAHASFPRWYSSAAYKAKETFPKPSSIISYI